MFYKPSVTTRLCRRLLPVALILVAAPSLARPIHAAASIPVKRPPVLPFSANAPGKPDQLDASERPLLAISDKVSRQEPDAIIFAMMSGKCRTLRVAGRDFGCRAVAFFQTEEGRANYTIVLDDPLDRSHTVTFSGDNGRRADNDLYELPVDRILLKSKDRPKADGLPVPFVEVSAGLCRQIGNFVTRRVSSVACSATDSHGKKYELVYETDGSPVDVRRIKRTRAGLPAMSPFD